MIEPELRRHDGILIVRPDAPLTEEDFEQVAALVDPYLDEHDRLQGILIHAPQFPGWDDFAALVTHFRFVRDHHERVERVAVVSRSALLEAMPTLAGHFVSAEIRTFPEDGYADALDWLLGEAPADG
ncbi:MAG: STAS/SEC14 domain-containing protein [Gammaproteobacteria bacterium]|nr:STAS/SEC14 domain-containing protein [Gammaproteobacteria bacterium]